MVIAFALLQALPDMLAVSSTVAPTFDALLADATTTPGVAVPSAASIDIATASEPVAAPLDSAAIMPLTALIPRITTIVSSGGVPVAAPGDPAETDAPPVVPSYDGPAPIATLLAALFQVPTPPASAPTAARSMPSPVRAAATCEIAAAALPVGHPPAAPDAPLPQPAAAPLSLIQPAAPAPLDALPEPCLDLSRDTAWIDTLARDIVAIGSADGKLRFALQPETLGRMEVDVRQSGDGVHVRVTAQSEPARMIIADAQPRLTDELRAQGVRVAETQVSAEAERHAARRHTAPRAIIEATTDPLPLRETAVVRDGRFA